MKIVQNAIKCPDGKILMSSYTHDYKNYRDSVTHEHYMVDGGLTCLRGSLNKVKATSLVLYEETPFEEVREKLIRVSRQGEYTLLKDMTDEYLFNTLAYNKGKGFGDSYYSKMYAKELDFRQRIQINQKEEQMENSARVKVDFKDLIKILSGQMPEIEVVEARIVSDNTENGIIIYRNSKKLFSTVKGDESGVTEKDLGTLCEQRSKLGAFKIVPTKVSVDGRISDVISNEIKEVQPVSTPKPKFLFMTEDGVEMYEGDNWWYIREDKYFKPRNTSVNEYKGKDVSEKVLTFSTKKAAKKAQEKSLRTQNVLSLQDVIDNVFNLENLVKVAKEKLK